MSGDETHLVRSEGVEEDRAFCGCTSCLGFESDIALVTCTECLRAAVELGEAAQKRLDEFFACTDCGENGFGVHACPGRPGENQW